MRIHDLSMPVWEGTGYGEIIPFSELPVRFFEYMVYERHGMRRSLMKIDGETGSPFMTPPQNLPFSPVPLQPNPKYSWGIDDVPLERLVLRDTVIVDVRVDPRPRDHARGDRRGAGRGRLPPGRRGAAAAQAGARASGPTRRVWITTSRAPACATTPACGWPRRWTRWTAASS